ncbi:MAG: 1,2-phenylacetyl-CoA epoxidase subunit PaaD [Flavisolibacter sp.]
MKETATHIATTEEKQIWEILEQVKDPEVPVLSVIDLGVIRDVNIIHIQSADEEKKEIHIIITPTYSGCPAIDMINMDIRIKLIEHGYRNVIIEQKLSPAWTTDWMTEEGKKKLKAYGISPPNPKQQFCSTEMFQLENVECPRCNSYHTYLISQFGSTACKSMYRCLDCKEPFDYFKCH